MQNVLEFLDLPKASMFAKLSRTTKRMFDESIRSVQVASYKAAEVLERYADQIEEVEIFRRTIDTTRGWIPVLDYGPFAVVPAGVTMSRLRVLNLGDVVLSCGVDGLTRSALPNLTHFALRADGAIQHETQERLAREFLPYVQSFRVEERRVYSPPKVHGPVILAPNLTVLSARLPGLIVDVRNVLELETFYAPVSFVGLTGLRAMKIHVDAHAADVIAWGRAVRGVDKVTVHFGFNCCEFGDEWFESDDCPIAELFQGCKELCVSFESTPGWAFELMNMVSKDVKNIGLVSNAPAWSFPEAEYAFMYYQEGADTEDDHMLDLETEIEFRKQFVDALYTRESFAREYIGVNFTVSL